MKSTRCGVYYTADRLPHHFSLRVMPSYQSCSTRQRQQRAGQEAKGRQSVRHIINRQQRTRGLHTVAGPGLFNTGDVHVQQLFEGQAILPRTKCGKMWQALIQEAKDEWKNAFVRCVKSSQADRCLHVIIPMPGTHACCSMPSMCAAPHPAIQC